MTDFDGLVALVTGGAGGIGAATAGPLRERGGRVAVLDRDVGARRPRPPRGAVLRVGGGMTALRL